MIKLYNTLTKQVEDFEPIDPNNVRLFVCGPTVYDYSHLGHAKTYVQLDVLARLLKSDYTTTYLQNITDIDDKIITRAAEQGIPWQELRDTYQQAYEEDMQQLGNTSVDRYARATDFIDDIIRQVEMLIEKDYAYVVEGDGIYFEIAKFADYGKLSGRTELQENDAQSRIDQSDHKRGWNDFALWKFSKPGEPVWPAPFGEGRPGWHIEDTAITEHFFGPQYDVHGGAIDLIFPHHEAEITQMESASGKVPFVRYWVHTGFLTIDDQKMSKSLHNFYTIREILEKYDPMAIRLFMLQSHYRSPINFSWDNLLAADNRLKHWRNVAALRHQTHEVRADHSENPSLAAVGAIKEALSNDLNTPEALRLIDETFSELEADHHKDLDHHSLVQLLETIDELLGLSLIDTTPDITDDQKQLILERERAREDKDWSRSDKLRDHLRHEGIEVRDTPGGPIWEYRPL